MSWIPLGYMCEAMKHYNSTQPTLTKHYIHGSLYPYFFPTSYIYICTHTQSHYLLLPPLCLYASPLSLSNHQWRWQQKNRRKRRRRKGPLCNFGLKVKDMDGNQWINYLRVGWQNGMMVMAGVCRSCLAMRNFKQVVVVQSTNLKQTQ